MGNGVEAALQLAHRDALGIHHKRHDVGPPRIVGILRMQLRQRIGQHAVRRRLPTERGPDDHEAVPARRVCDLHAIDARRLRERRA